MHVAAGGVVLEQASIDPAAVEAYLSSKEIAIAVVNTYAQAFFQDSDNPKLASNPSNVVFERIAAKLAPSDAPPTRNSAGPGGPGLRVGGPSRGELGQPLHVCGGRILRFHRAVAPPRAQPGLVQLAIVVLALTLGAAGGLDPRPAYVAAAIAASVLLLGWLVRALEGWTPRWSPTALSVLVALVGAVLWLPYALKALEQSRIDGLGDITNGIEHWPVQGATGLALAIGAVVMAGWLPARPLFRVSISMSAVFIGMAGLAYPDRDGATQGLPWAVTVTVWGLLVAMTPTPTDAT